MSAWSSDVCASDRAGGRPASLGLLLVLRCRAVARRHERQRQDSHRPVTHRKSPSCVMFVTHTGRGCPVQAAILSPPSWARGAHLSGKRSEEHTSELQSLMRNSYAVFCLKKKRKMK